MNIGIQLTEKQITSLKNKANIEVDREIYSIRFDSEEITINGSWSIQRKNKPINKEIISAIEIYCRRNNIDGNITRSILHGVTNIKC
jgi:hypothetical protein